MICKVAEPEVDTEDLIWQPLGSNAGPTTRRTSASASASSPLGLRDAASSLSARDQDIDADGQRRLAELEVRHAAQVDQARKSGLEQGLKQGRQEAALEMEEALDRLAQTVQNLVQLRSKVRNEAENELVKLSLAIARRILHREVTADPESLRGVVYAALQRLQNREVTRVRVFPASEPAVRAALERNGGMGNIEIMSDNLLPPGGLLFETALGQLDASVETQLQEIERGFADRLQLR